MNETVKAALLSSRERAQSHLAMCENDVASLTKKLAASEAWVQSARNRLADIELHLRDNGVDLAAVDAEAEKARAVVNLVGQHSLMGQQAALYQDARGGVNQNLSRALSSFGAANYDPTAGLAKALDEA